MIWPRRHRAPYAWTKAARGRGFLIGSYGPMVHAIFPTKHGALLYWTVDYDGRTGDRATLIASLTNREARKVVETDRMRVGMLEDFRSSMRNPEAILMFESGGGAPGMQLIAKHQIPRTASEEEFLAGVDRVVEDLRASGQPAPSAPGLSSDFLVDLEDDVRRSVSDLVSH